MLVKFDELKVLQAAEELSDGLWDIVVKWDEFTKNTIGQQLVRAADSIGANIAESYGRYHYGEKLQFLYYGRGSLFEAKYWLNRANQRQLLTADSYEMYSHSLSSLAQQLNAFLKSIREQKKGKTVRESGPYYETTLNTLSQQSDLTEDIDLFSQDDLDSLSRTQDATTKTKSTNQPINH